MRIVLTRSASFRIIELNAEMEFGATRPELLLLCRLAAENGDRLTPEVLLNSVPGLTSIAQAHNIVSFAAELGLLDPSGFLTPRGRRALEEDVVFLPETGVYGFWVLEDAANLGAFMLHCERQDALHTAASIHDLTPLDVNLPQGPPARSCIDPGLQFALLDLSFIYADRAEPMTRTVCKHDNMQLEWLLSGDTSHTQVQVSGAVPKSIKDAIAKPQRMYKVMADIEGPEVSFTEVAGHALSAIKGARWDHGSGALAVQCPESERERSTFLRDVELGGVDIPGYGQFRSAAVHGVPLVPASHLAAREWADRLCLDRLQDYTAVGDLQWDYEKSVTNTVLSKFACAFPGLDALIGRLDGNAKTDVSTVQQWYLLAPQDLRPDILETAPPISDALLRIRTNETAQPPAASDQALAVHLLPAEKPSPVEVLRRLMISEDTHRVLYCDRYIDQRWHYERLRTVVQSIRQLSPQVNFSVMTFRNHDVEVAKEQKRQIEAITTNGPVWYQDVCKEKPYPHDRYLVISGKDEEDPRFWKITNGLLSFDAIPGASLKPSTGCVWRSQSFVSAPAEGIPVEIRTIAKASIR